MKNVMKRRLYFIPIAVIVITLLIVGSIYDLNISKSIVQLRNGFSIFMSAITGFPFGFILCFVGGNLLAFYIKNKSKYKWYIHVLNIMAIIVFELVGGYLFSSLVVSYHSFGISKIFIIPISLITIVPGGILGFKLFPKFDKPYYIKCIIFLSIVVCIPLGIMTVLKWVAPRVRYTTLVALNNAGVDGFSYFRAWFAPGVDKEKITEILGSNLESEAFKSFPSGHTTLAWCALPFIMSLLIFNEKLRKYDWAFFYGYFVFIALVIFSRIFIGAHYLTDTMFASLVCLMVYYIAYEIYVRKLNFTVEKNNEISAH